MASPDKIEANNLTRRGAGRPKGAPNKTTALLKDAILKAADAAGGEASSEGPGGIVAYLTAQAVLNPAPFMSLLGKVLPMQISGEGGGPIRGEIKIIIVDPKR